MDTRGRRRRCWTRLFGEVTNIRVRTNLMDCHVDICAPEFLMLFTDNFDYQSIRRDFIVGTLNERELGNTLYGHEISTREYAARCTLCDRTTRCRGTC